MPTIPITQITSRLEFLSTDCSQICSLKVSQWANHQTMVLELSPSHHLGLAKFLGRCYVGDVPHSRKEDGQCILFFLADWSVRSSLCASMGASREKSLQNFVKRLHHILSPILVRNVVSQSRNDEVRDPTKSPFALVPELELADDNWEIGIE
jgi:hypothetical protein